MMIGWNRQVVVRWSSLLTCVTVTLLTFAVGQYNYHHYITTTQYTCSLPSSIQFVLCHRFIVILCCSSSHKQQSSHYRAPTTGHQLGTNDNIKTQAVRRIGPLKHAHSLTRQRRKKQSLQRDKPGGRTTLTTLAMLEPPLYGLAHDAARPAGPSATPTLTPMNETSRIYCSKFQAKITASRSHAMQVQYP